MPGPGRRKPFPILRIRAGAWHSTGGVHPPTVVTRFRLLRRLCPLLPSACCFLPCRQPFLKYLSMALYTVKKCAGPLFIVRRERPLLRALFVLLHGGKNVQRCPFTQARIRRGTQAFGSCCTASRRGGFCVIMSRKAAKGNFDASAPIPDDENPVWEGGENVRPVRAWPQRPPYHQKALKTPASRSMY